MRSKDLIQILNAIHEGPDAEISNIAFDSRQIAGTTGVMFLALKTAYRDGHMYIPQLIEHGITCFMVEHDYVPNAIHNKALTWIRVKGVLQHLQIWAAWKRSQFKGFTIAITGSQGKTIVKEWLYQLLKTDYQILRSPRSFNSQLGVALSILRLESHHNLALIEAGISMPGEMQALQEMIKPDMVVFTSLGSPHDEAFSSRTEKLQEKLKLTSQASVVIAQQVAKPNLFNGTWLEIGPNGAMSYYVDHDRIHITYDNLTHIFNLPFNDESSVRNAVTCIGVLLYLQYTPEQIQSRILSLKSISLRLDVKKAWANSILINDYYNADIESLEIALQFMYQQSERKRSILIVSDLEQSGLSAQQRMSALSRCCARFALDYCFLVGEVFLNTEIKLHCSYRVFKDTNALISSLNEISPYLSEARILIKGARSYHFEKLASRLQLQSHATVFEVNLSRLRDNLNYFKSHLNPKVKIMGMVKAMAYGSGGVEIARFLQQCGVAYLAVAYTDEGIALRNAKVTVPIMVMNPEEDSFEELIKNNLEPEIYNFKILNKCIEVAEFSALHSIHIHIKLDTGMHRLGFTDADMVPLLEILKTHPRLHVASVFSHFTASDDPNADAWSTVQWNRFTNMYNVIQGNLKYPIVRHMANTNAILRLHQSHMDMVRLGIGLYGIAQQGTLQSVCKWYTQISQIRIVEAGETIGYGKSAVLTTATHVATLPVGYADGLSRTLGNEKHGVYIHNTFCKILGSVCMDMIMVDVTQVKCQEGDQAVIFENITQLLALSKAMHTIPYEVLTSVSSRVKRVYTMD
jgi:alanine racemase